MTQPKSKEVTSLPYGTHARSAACLTCRLGKGPGRDSATLEEQLNLGVPQSPVEELGNETQSKSAPAKSKRPVGELTSDGLCNASPTTGAGSEINGSSTVSDDNDSTATEASTKSALKKVKLQTSNGDCDGRRLMAGREAPVESELCRELS